MWRAACSTCSLRNMTKPRPISRTADALDPRQSMGSAAEGLAAVQENDPDRALATVRAKLVKRPNDPFLLYLQADILTQRGPDPGSLEFREAMESAKKAIALRPC